MLGVEVVLLRLGDVVGRDLKLPTEDAVLDVFRSVIGIYACIFDELLR